MRCTRTSGVRLLRSYASSEPPRPLAASETRGSESEASHSEGAPARHHLPVAPPLHRAGGGAPLHSSRAGDAPGAARRMPARSWCLSRCPCRNIPPAMLGSRAGAIGTRGRCVGRCRGRERRVRGSALRRYRERVGFVTCRFYSLRLTEGGRRALRCQSSLALTARLISLRQPGTASSTSCAVAPPSVSPKDSTSRSPTEEAPIMSGMRGGEKTP